MNLAFNAPALQQEAVSLVRQAIKGNAESFGQLCMLYERDLYAVSYCILQNKSDCADAVQEALIKAYTKMNQLKDPAYFKTWLTRILINECNRMAKRNARRQNVPYITEVQGADSSSDIPALIAELPSEQRLVLVLRYYQGYSVAEIAKMLRIPQGTVKSRAAVARSKIRQRLEAE